VKRPAGSSMAEPLISHAIQLAIAPVFLLTGIAGLLSVTLFVDDLWSTDLRWLAGGLFVGAMAALIGGLSCFLREVYLATHATDIELARFEQTAGTP
jgi:uncharacterized protein DUF2721